MSLNLRDGTPAASETPTPWGVYCRQGETIAECCNKGELVYLTHACYIAQLNQPDSFWSCPYCGGSAVWSDENYERAMAAAEESESEA